MKNQVLQKTLSYCYYCQKDHEAYYMAEGNTVFFMVECNRGRQKEKISSDKDIFLGIRKKSGVNLDRSPTINYSWGHRLPITNRCNYFCNICYANGGEPPRFQLTEEDILKTGKVLKNLKRKYITLGGGEPTLHPHLINFVHTLSKQGLKVSLLTNGLLLNRRQELSARLKRAGVHIMYVQFDTLNEDTYRLYRNNNHFMENDKALALLSKDKHKLGVNTVVTPENLQETGNILTHLSRYTPSLKTVVFLAAVSETGRYRLPAKEPVTREDIIHSLVKTLPVAGISPDSFYPFPYYPTLYLEVHPDCAALLFLAVINGTYELLDNYIDIKKLYRKLASSPHGKKKSLWRGDLRFLFTLISSIHKGKLWKVMRMLFGYKTGRGKYSLIIVSIEQFLGPLCRDKARIERCTTMHVTPSGNLVPMCVFYHPLENQHMSM